MLIYYTQLFWVFENHVTSRCQGLFPPILSSAEKSPGNEVGDFRKTTKGSKQVRGPTKGKTPTKAIFFSPASSLVNDLNSVEIVKGLWEVQGGTSGNEVEYREVSWGNT